MKRENVKELLEKIGKQEYTAEEETKAKRWLFQLNQQSSTGQSEEDIQSAKEEIWNRLEVPQQKNRVRRLWLAWAAVASIIVMMIAGSLFYINPQQSHSTHTVYKDDVAPGRNGATLTLADGTIIQINDAFIGDIAQQSGVTISKDPNGHIIYEITEEPNGDIAFNTLTTMRGEQTKIRLPDGSLVSLNASSSLRYPTSFSNANKRTVFLKGEGYFQITKNRAQPFVVETEQQHIQVLGTHFNINAYDPLLAVTTLEEGSIKILAAEESKIIHPGQQVLNDGTALRVEEADLEQVLGWKDGNFVFSGADIRTVMGQLERWYDVEADYSEPLAEGVFYANISRNRNLSEILKILEKTNGVHFKIQGRRIIVSK